MGETLRREIGRFARHTLDVWAAHIGFLLAGLLIGLGVGLLFGLKADEALCKYWAKRQIKKDDDSPITLTLEFEESDATTDT